MHTTKSFLNLVFAMALILAVASFTPAYAQPAIANTTAAVAVGQTDSFVVVASATGITGQGSLGQYTTMLYVDRELMGVISVAGTQVFVQRGQLGTSQQAHPLNAVVWIGTPSQFPAGGGDPTGSCTPTNLSGTPFISINTGRIWVCNAATNQWGTEGVMFIPGSVCGFLATTTAVTDNGMVSAATGNVVRQLTTNTTGGTMQLTCPLTSGLESRLTSGKGVVLTDVDLLYGVQTTAISSIAAAAVKSVSYPASTSAGAAAAGTVAAAGGTYVVTPGTLQKATTTSGQCYNEKVSFGTPIAVNTDNQSITLDQVFTNSAAATQYQVCGLLVHYYVPAPPNL